jgi:hypothetical protein
LLISEDKEAAVAAFGKEFDLYISEFKAEPAKIFPVLRGGQGSCCVSVETCSGVGTVLVDVRWEEAMALGCYAAGCVKLQRTTKSQAGVQKLNTSNVE